MEYIEEFETRSDVKRMVVSEGKMLYFVPDGTGKYTFCSKDDELQKWCESTKTKRVKSDSLKFVVKGAKDYLKGKTPLRDTSIKTFDKQKTYSVTPDKCGNWEKDAVSALQIFCQKNKIDMPEYISAGTSQGYVTQSSMTLKIGDYTTIQTAGTKKEAKQKCAMAFYNEVLMASDTKVEQKSHTEQKTIEKPDPSQIKGWKKNPLFALETYCERYNISLQVEEVDEEIVLTVGADKFYAYRDDYGSLYKAKEELAKLYYQRKIDPILKKMQKKAIDNSSNDVLLDFPVPNMGEYQEKDNILWAAKLNQLCAKAHLPLPEFIGSGIVKNGIETKCSMPNKINLTGWQEGETRVMYLRMPGIDGKIRGEGKQFQDAKHDAAKNCLRLIWYSQKIKIAEDMGDDKMVDFYTGQKQKLEKKCLVGTQIHKPQQKNQPQIENYEQGLELLMAKYNGK